MKREGVANSIKSSLLAGEVFKKFFWDAYDNLGRLISVNILWFIMTLPLILIFAFRLRLSRGFFLVLFFPFAIVSILAAVSVFYITFLVAEGKKIEIIREFFAGMKRFLYKGILLGILSLLFFIAGVFDLQFYASLKTSVILSAILVGIGIWLVLMGILIQNYLFPLLVQKDLSVSEILQNTIYLVLDNPNFTFLIFLQALILFFVLGISLCGIPVLFISLPALLYNEALRILLIRKYGMEGEILEEKRGWKEFWFPWKQ